MRTWPSQGSPQRTLPGDRDERRQGLQQHCRKQGASPGSRVRLFLPLEGEEVGRGQVVSGLGKDLLGPSPSAGSPPPRRAGHVPSRTERLRQVSTQQEVAPSFCVSEEDTRVREARGLPKASSHSEAEAGLLCLFIYFWFCICDAVGQL